MRINSIRFTFLLAILLCAEFTVSQNYVDILRLSAYTTPPNKFDTGSNKTKINHAALDFTLPIKVNDKLSVITGFASEYYQAQLFETGNVESFGSFILKAGVNIKFDSSWSATFMALPKTASDHIGIGNNDFQMGGLVVFKYLKNANFNWRFGMYYNSDLFGPFIVPAVGFYYISPNKKFETTWFLPISADMNYRLTPLMSIGANYIGLVDSYNMNAVYPGSCLETSTDDFYAYLKFNLGKNFIIQTKLGQSIWRTYKVYNYDEKVSADLAGINFGSKRQYLNTEFSNGLIFQLVLLYRFNL